MVPYTVPSTVPSTAGAAGDWVIEHLHGDGAEFHDRVPGGSRALWWLEVDRPLLALGSTQQFDRVDERVASAFGVSTVRRRSGGGGVLLLPGEFVWVDLVVPVDDALWDDDVGRAAHWVGSLWCEVLAGLGFAATVHRGPMIKSRWSSQVCFSGTGPGEVLGATGRKLVGISQRRTRHWARFQTMCHLRWRPELVAALVAAPRPRPEDIAAAAIALGGAENVVSPGPTARTVVAALVAALP